MLLDGLSVFVGRNHKEVWNVESLFLVHSLDILEARNGIAFEEDVLSFQKLIGPIGTLIYFNFDQTLNCL